MIDLSVIVRVRYLPGRSRGGGEESPGCHHNCSSSCSTCCPDHRHYLCPEEAEEERHLLYQSPEDQCMWAIKPCLLWQGMCVSSSCSPSSESSLSSCISALHAHESGKQNVGIWLHFIPDWLCDLGMTHLARSQMIGFREETVGTALENLLGSFHLQWSMKHN